ncbi:MAG TPA: glycosyltransferase family 2 protein [Candidatus Marinimicrobia bacterium]|nr:glycosyltransferase family 2 protein [Candidatus Neomarinimicrobiota bacterium]HRS51470.1 glycosyltransferase family 2 protein [Candidatus Neomarinimicrobiota bacterium]HRU92740.1 glycosyltransferase family 2 protein [Candidatus Neomarinimicrobiota bacterium]
MNLVIQVPCYNEESTIKKTLDDLPKSIPGIDSIEILIIDDGCQDRTVEIARQWGVHHFVHFNQNKGLARAFEAGLEKALELGADIIVNTDADNQYKGSDIARLVQPILDKKAEIVIGDRQIDKIEDFSWLKKKLEKLGSYVVRKVSQTKIPDTTSGFRAYSREAALQINIISTFSYTLETIIEAGQKDIPIISVPIEANKTERPSRLFKSNWYYIRRSFATIVRIYTMYQPLRVFFYTGVTNFGIGLLLSIRYLIFMIIGQGKGHIQSVIIAAVFLIIGFFLLMIGLLADVIAANRKLLEETLYRIKKDYLN